jgi:type IV pilus assembly protein PilB
MTDKISDKILQLDRSQEENATKGKAATLNIQYLDLTKTELDEKVLRVVPKQVVESSQCIAIVLNGSKLLLGVVNPESEGVKKSIADLVQTTGFEINLALISPSSFAYAKKTYDLLVHENVGEQPVVISKQNIEELNSIALQMETDKPLGGVSVTDQLSAILSKAVELKASDIHLEPAEKDLEIRFRIDGVLHKKFERPISEFHGLSSRIKYLAKMPLVTAEEPQDGRFTINVVNDTLDLRVASLPTVYGDMITIRILNKDKVMFNLSQLGLRQDLEAIMHDAIKKPHGLVLVTGPTGSGKTTTLYGFLRELNSEERKIITIEDPVEYKLEGLEQSQVDSERGYTFVEALRGALRQDPDVIMIGEIRDKETAGIGIRAALTGHIVLATMHSNSAPSAYNRLLEMNVEPFLFSGSVNIIIAQRLIRLLCSTCKKERHLTNEETKTFEHNLGRVPEKIFEPNGCEDCGGIGYTGRTAIFEALVPSRAMEQLALNKASISEFEDQASRDGMISLFQDGLLKVEQGVTSLAEVYRVTRE